MSKNGLSEREILIPVWNKNEPYFEYTDKQRKEIVAIKGNPWRVVPDDKSVPAHKQASTCESLLGIYPEAIEIGSTVGAGETFYLGVSGVVLGLLAGVAFLWAGARMMLSYNSELADYIFGSVVVFVGLFFLLVGRFSFCMVFLMPRDFPVLFNKKGRQVIFMPAAPIPFWKFWKNGGLGPIQVASWEKAKVRSYKFAEAPGGRVFRDVYLLRLLWEDPSQPKKLKKCISIGYKGWWEDERLFRLWEHIRRYMEEDGPAIQPGETLRTSGHGKLPKFPADIIAAAGGSALTAAQVAALSGSIKA